jgi:predicted kinase
MGKFVINRGLPGSGKSTETFRDVVNDYQGTVRVNRDDIRKMLHKSVWLGKTTEGNVIAARNDLLRGAMKRNVPLVISDDTNLDTDVVKQLAKIAEFFGYEIVVRDFDTPLDVCIERDAKREGTERVGEKVILDMYNRFFKGGQFPDNPLKNNIKEITFAPYVPNMALPKAAIFDIDGTLADHTGLRSPYDYTKVINDRPRPSVIAAAVNYHKAGYKIIKLSGREDSCRPDTEKWLDRELIYGNDDGSIESVPYVLFMRPAGDKRQDRIIKGEIFDRYIRNFYNVEAAFDDRNQVVRLWRDEIKLPCFQVNDGDF